MPQEHDVLTLDEIKKTYRSLWIHRLRTLLSTLGILFGVAAVLAMLSIGEGAKKETLQQIEQLGANSILIRSISLSNEQRGGLSLDDAEALKQNIPFLVRSAPLKAVEASVIAKQIGVSEILAVTKEFGEIKGLRTSEGRFICDLDNQDKGKVCILGSARAQSLGKEGHVGKVFGLKKPILKSWVFCMLRTGSRGSMVLLPRAISTKPFLSLLDQNVRF